MIHQTIIYVCNDKQMDKYIFKYKAENQMQIWNEDLKNIKPVMINWF